MRAAAGSQAAPAALSTGRRAGLAVVCILAGFLPVAVGYVPGEAARFAIGVLVTAAFLALALWARQRPAWRGSWEIPLAFFGMALFVLADRYVPNFLQTQILHDAPRTSNALASTIVGTMVNGLDELLLTVVAVLVVVMISRGSLRSLYVRKGRWGRAYVVGILGFLAFYVLTFRVLSHTRFMPVHGTVDFSRYLSLTPALLVVVAMNGFLEELMFRGLLMSKLNLAFGPYASTIVQAVIFASWHVGVTYTSSVLVFVVLVVLPLGLIAGYLTRSSGSIFPSAIFHAGADIPIYLGFLSYVS